ncbi:MAG: glycosyltransferase family 2 protein [Bacteroidaceae bacterium]|nr:glycosyltransferase family 2 protein [Bacteroidaceae bacterium]
MKALHIITPVKDSIDSTIDTMTAIRAAQLSMPHRYTIYNDLSTPENTARLHREAEALGIEVVDLDTLTDTPSPNYLFVLRHCQQLALEADAGLLIVESDVTIQPDTLQRLYDAALQRPDCGLAAAVTVDEQGAINYPYLYAKGWDGREVDCAKHLSFCCTLLTPALLQRVDFGALDDSKNWFDVTISHLSREAGLRNWLFCNLPVLHRPHASRPWKQLKYTNPLKYYWLKWTKGFDKI